MSFTQSNTSNDLLKNKPTNELVFEQQQLLQRADEIAEKRCIVPSEPKKVASSLDNDSYLRYSCPWVNLSIKR
jgi:hypothetical protein